MAASCRGFPPPPDVQSVGLMLFVCQQGWNAVYVSRNRMIARYKYDIIRRKGCLLMFV